MAAEEDEVDIEGIGEDDDLVDYKDMIENSDVISWCVFSSFKKTHSIQSYFQSDVLF